VSHLVYRKLSKIVTVLGVAAAVAATLALGACGNGDASAGGDSGGERKLIIFAMPFPCNLNDYAKLTCEGAELAGKNLPPGYELQIKTERDYTDAPAFNALLQNSLQLSPAGFVVFANGPAAQTPILNQACDKGVKVIFYDTKGNDVKCEMSHVTPNHTELGEKAAQWLIDHPPAGGGKEVAIVSQQPGQFESNDARVKGFTDAVEAGGYKVVAVVASTNELDETRTKITNVVTAHPNLAAIFSANGPLGQGTHQALKDNDDVVQLTTDGNVSDIPSILEGTVGVNVAQAPYIGGRLAVEFMVKVLEGKDIPKVHYTPTLAVDKSNAQAFIDKGGLK